MTGQVGRTHRPEKGEGIATGGARPPRAERNPWPSVTTVRFRPQRSEGGRPGPWEVDDPRAIHRTRGVICPRPTGVGQSHGGYSSFVYRVASRGL